jgi:hypothetical protein
MFQRFAVKRLTQLFLVVAVAAVLDLANLLVWAAAVVVARVPVRAFPLLRMVA